MKFYFQLDKYETSLTITSMLMLWTVFVCLVYLIYSNKTSLELQTFLFLFLSKICTSKLGVRLIYGCGLYTDVYGNFPCLRVAEGDDDQAFSQMGIWVSCGHPLFGENQYKLFYWMLV